MINYIEAGTRIRARRKELKLTQEFVAEKIDITPSFYSQIESGSRKAGINTFVGIARELSVTLDYILGEKNELILPENFDNIDAMIFNRMKDFTDIQKECVLDIITSLQKFTTKS